LPLFYWKWLNAAGNCRQTEAACCKLVATSAVSTAISASTARLSTHYGDLNALPLIDDPEGLIGLFSRLYATCVALIAA
jgi:hypothetical protein